MMGKKNKDGRSQIEFISLEELVPRNHLVRKLEEAIDLSFIYDEVEDLYKPYGRESIDPVVLIKINILQYVFGISSMRRTIREIEVNLAYRWYLGYGMYEDIPHFSTFGKNYQRRFKDSGLFEKIFTRIIREVEISGFLDDENLFIDGTHLKANANNHKYRNEVVEKSVRYYEEILQEEITLDRQAHGKKPLKEKQTVPEVVNRKVSTTDPECGLFHKGEHKKTFAYTANTCCDGSGYVLGFEVVPGNVNDGTSFFKLYQKLKKERPESVRYVMDSGYRTPAIARELIEDGKIPVMPYKRPQTKDGFFKKYEYVYDEYYDCYLCPNNEVLPYRTTNREGYREYKSDGRKCKKCPYLKKCTESKNYEKTVTQHVWESYIEQVEEIRHTLGTKEIYNQRKETIERVFADGKEKHGLRYTQYRGLEKVKMELNLLFASMNLKKLAIWKWRKKWGPLYKETFYLLGIQNMISYTKWALAQRCQNPFCLQSELLTNQELS